MAGKNPQELFNQHYFRTGCGIPYQRDEHWTAFFGAIAKEIVHRISPRSVFDAGCALGLLVEQLRLLGVDAEGVDISEFAIANAPEFVRPFVRVASVTEPLERRYDLIVCIEVLEHMPPPEAEAAIANLTSYSDDILFSSSPLDFKEATHFNVHPIEHWAELFAHHGFVRDVDFDTSFITPWAMRLRRKAEPLPRIVRDYERRYWEVWKAASDLRELVLNQRSQIESLVLEIESLRLQLTSEHEKLVTYAKSLEECSQSFGEQQQALIITQHERDAVQQGYERLKMYVQDLEADREQKIAHINDLEADREQKIAHINDLKLTIARLEAGRVMRLLRALEDRRSHWFRSGDADHR
ncbi:MAG: methyltransferase domain-containing protein [Chloroflexaceae bacterium]